MHYLKIYFKNFWQPKSAVLEIEKSIKSLKIWIILLFMACLIAVVVNFWIVIRHPEWQALLDNLIGQPAPNQWVGIIVETVYKFLVVLFSVSGIYFFINFFGYKSVKYFHLMLLAALIVSYGAVFQLFNIFLLDLKDAIPLFRGLTQYPYVAAMIWIAVVIFFNVSSLLKFNIFKSILTSLLTILTASLISFLLTTLFNFFSQTPYTEQSHINQRALTERIIKNPNKYSPLHLYKASNDLFEEGQKDEAVFWYSVGQLRARYDANRTNDTTAASGVTVLNMRYGEFINKYAFADVEKLKTTVRAVLEFVENNEEKYDPTWLSHHGMDAFNSSKASPMKPKSEWPAIKKQSIEDYQAGFEEALKILENIESDSLLTQIQSKETTIPEVQKTILTPENFGYPNKAALSPEELDPDYFYTDKSFLITASTKDFSAALKQAIEASERLKIDLKIDDTELIDGELVNTDIETCEAYNFEEKCYFARGRYDDGYYVSIENSAAYENFTDGYFIVIVASDFPENNDLTDLLKKVKTMYPDAYIKNSRVFMGSYL